MDMDLSAIIPVFLAECEEGLAGMEDALLALEARPDDAEALNTVFRVAHTLKGNAATLGFPPAAEFAHELEDVLERLRDGRTALTHPLAGALLESVDALRALVPAATEGRDELNAAERALLARLAALASGGAEDSAASTGPGASADAESADSRSSADSTASADSPESADHAASAGASVDARDGADGAAGSGVAAARARSRRTLRVNVEVLDRALDVVGEITIARGRLAQMMADGAPAELLAESHGDGERLHLALQELVMRLRMVPLGPVFRPYVRTVRDLAFAHGKLARVVVRGEDVEVDTSVVEHLRDPLTHMVRNAVDHGIETPQARIAAGKDPCGTVTLSARHEGASLVVRMTDDGAGLSRARIAARARERGLAADPERMGDAELFRLILEPGFSTAREVTDLSGRGVGLDVVRRGIEGLRGSVGIASEAGRGTTITLRMPLTLALIDGFSVGVEDDTFVLPLECVVECLELPRDRHEQGGEGVLSLRGAPLPFLRLRDFLGMPGRAEGRESVVVIRHDGGHAGVVVDALHGATQAVVKPLGRTFDGLAGFSGSTILGSGRVGLILDVPTLLRQAVERAAAAA